MRMIIYPPSGPEVVTIPDCYGREDAKRKAVELGSPHMLTVCQEDRDVDSILALVRGDGRLPAWRDAHVHADRERVG